MEKLNFYDSLRFLLFISFSIDIDDSNLDKDTVIRAAVSGAFNDATMHLLSVKDDNEKVKLRNQAEELVSNNVIGLITSNGKDFKDKYNELCINVINVYCEEKTPELESYLDFFEKRFNRSKSGKLMYFTQGMAQKFINMTIKNLCIMYHIFNELKENYAWENGEIKLPVELAQNEEEFFAPVDTYTIKAAWNHNDQNGWNNNKSAKIPMNDNEWEGVKNPKGKQKYGVFSTDKILPWSKWKIFGEKNPYDDFQSTIISDNTKTRLKWENDAWIKTANEANK
ncbi:MAG: hypothetical protein UFA98_06420 [Ruminococcus sp.]|nr:hypothetical protein [Ruminococcus sp.]